MKLKCSVYVWEKSEKNSVLHSEAKDSRLLQIHSMGISLK